MTTPSAPPAAAPRLRFTFQRFSWGHAIIVVFVVWVAFMLTFLTSAIVGGTDTLQHERPYERGLAYEARLERLRRTEAAAERVNVRLDAQRRVLVLTGPVGVVGELRFTRPNDNTRDFVVPIRIAQGPAQEVPLSAVPAGRWRTELSYRWQNQDYLAESELFLGE